MGKIGNSLSSTVRKILSGAVKEEEIEKIYCGTCIPMENFIDEVPSSYIGNWVGEVLEDEVNELAFKRLSRAMNEEEQNKIIEEIKMEVYTKDNIERAKQKVKEVLSKLLAGGKIIQTRYEIPETQETAEINYTSIRERYIDGKKITSEEVSGESLVDGWSVRAEVTNINGKLYKFIDNHETSLESGGSGIFDNELELIVSEMTGSSELKDERVFFMQEMFPQYREQIDKIAKLMRGQMEKRGFAYVTKQDLYDVLVPEHTADEISEDINSLPTKELVSRVLKTITQDKEKSLEQATH